MDFKKKQYGFDKFTWCLEKQARDGNLTNGELLAIKECPIDNYTSVSETDKAEQLEWHTKYGIIKTWVPKSCIIKIKKGGGR